MSTTDRVPVYAYDPTVRSASDDELDATRNRDYAISHDALGRETKRWLQEQWNAELISTYACSELGLAAIACPRDPNRYHFDHTMYAEVVDPQTSKPVDVGQEGRILLTGLYPFQQVCMFVRYEIGDWGRWRGDGVCECGVQQRT